MSRIHIALEVSDIQRSRAFYEILLGVAPSKVRGDYVKFEPSDPSVNLTLNQAAQGVSPATDSVSHYGIQVASSEAVSKAQQRFRAAGLALTTEEGTTCCYAVQDKVWVTDPDGNPWEVFTVLQEDAPERKAEDAGGCCVPGPGDSGASTCC